MAAWAEFEAEEPAIAAAGQRLLRPNGDGIAFLATVRGDGGPRLHPVMPVLAAGRLHVFVVRLAPKYTDLQRDGRFALHALPPDHGGEEFYVTGRAEIVEDADRRGIVTTASGGRLGLHDFEALFALDVRHVLHTVWADWGTARAWPDYRKWRAN